MFIYFKGSGVSGQRTLTFVLTWCSPFYCLHLLRVVNGEYQKCSFVTGEPGFILSSYRHTVHTTVPHAQSRHIRMTINILGSWEVRGMEPCQVGDRQRHACMYIGKYAYRRSGGNDPLTRSLPRVHSFENNSFLALVVIMSPFRASGLTKEHDSKVESV